MIRRGKHRAARDILPSKSTIFKSWISANDRATHATSQFGNLPSSNSSNTGGGPARSSRRTMLPFGAIKSPSGAPTSEPGASPTDKWGMSVNCVEHADLGGELRNQAELGTCPDQNSHGFLQEPRRKQTESGEKIGVTIDIVDNRFAALSLKGSEKQWCICSSQTRASFQARLWASWMPLFIPCPPAGLLMWQASPAKQRHAPVESEGSFDNGCGKCWTRDARKDQDQTVD